jgi:hypothetical protein
VEGKAEGVWTYELVEVGENWGSGGRIGGGGGLGNCG